MRLFFSSFLRTQQNYYMTHNTVFCTHLTWLMSSVVLELSWLSRFFFPSLQSWVPRFLFPCPVSGCPSSWGLVVLAFAYYALESSAVVWRLHTFTALVPIHRSLVVLLLWRISTVTLQQNSFVINTKVTKYKMVTSKILQRAVLLLLCR